MAGAVPAQAQVRARARKSLKLYGFTYNAHSLHGNLGVAVIVAAERRGDQSRGSISDRAAVYSHHGQHDLARRSDECFARLVSLFDCKNPFFERKPLRLDHIDHDRSGNARKDVFPKWMRDELAVAADDPGTR